MAHLAGELIIKAPMPIWQKVYAFLRNKILSNPIPADYRLVEGRPG